MAVALLYLNWFTIALIIGLSLAGLCHRSGNDAKAAVYADQAKDQALSPYCGCHPASVIKYG